RLRGSAPSHHHVPRALDVQERQLAIVANAEARYGVVTAVRSEQEPSVGREDDAGGSLECVRRTFLAADRLEGPGTGATCRDTFRLRNRTVGGASVVNDAVSRLVRLHVEMSAAVHLHLVSSSHTCYSACWFS